MESNLNIKSLVDILRRDDGVGVKYYILELSWILFLKIFEEMEKNEAKLNTDYQPILLNTKYTWSAWTKNKEFVKDADKMLDFVKKELFPYLASLSSKKAYILRIIFGELKKPHIRNGSTLIDIVKKIDQINYSSNSEDTHILSQAYEELLSNMGSEAGWAGEYYTPRAVIKMIVNILQPSIKEKTDLKILDPFAGSGGFLAEAYKFCMNENLSQEQIEKLKNDTFFAYEKKAEAYLIGLMNLILHGIDHPYYELGNTFLKDKERFYEKYDFVLTNPPFGGKESKSVYEGLSWVDYKISSTEALGLQFVMKSLKIQGQAGVVLPAGQIFFGTGNFEKIRRDLLERFNLKYLIFLPDGTFASVGTSIKTAVLIFEKGESTKITKVFKIKGKYTKKKIIKYENLSQIVDFINGKIKEKPENLLLGEINWEKIREFENKLNKLIEEIEKILNLDKGLFLDTQKEEILGKIKKFFDYFFESEFYQKKQYLEKQYYRQLLDKLDKSFEIEKLLEELKSEKIKITYSFMYEPEEEKEELEPGITTKQIDYLLNEINKNWNIIKENLEI